MSSFTIETQTWAQRQFGRCHLGDKRRTKRLIKMATQAANHPAGSFPEQVEAWADLKAAYRLFDARGASFEAIARPHWEQTRHQPAGRYLVLGDTTELDFGQKRNIPDLGPTGNGRGLGFLLHSGLMVGAETEEIFGMAGQTIHYRQPAPKKENNAQRLKRDRESRIWGDVIDQVGRPPEGTQFVHTLDRGADNFEVFCHLRENDADWVVRVAQKHRKIITPDGAIAVLSEHLATLPVAGTYELSLRAREKQPARTAKLEVGYGSLAIPVPSHASLYVKEVNSGPIPMGIVWIREVDWPVNVKPIEWVLYTSLPVKSFDEAWTVISYYEKRWLIEEYHKALKTGCRVTERQLKTKERLEAMVGLMSVVSVRLLQLKSVSRTHPESPAKRYVPARWIAMLQAVRRNLSPSRELTLRQFYRELAQLGGFIGRKSDGEPGWITIWRGWEKLHLIIRGSELTEELRTKTEKCG